MKFRSLYHQVHVQYDLILSETDVNGLAVYRMPLDDGGFAYRLFRPIDMVEVPESQDKHRI